MSAWLLGLLDRLPSRVRRCLMIALPLALLGVLVVGFALAPRWAGTHSKPATPTGLRPPSPTTAAQAPARPAPPAEAGQSPVAARAGRGQRARKRWRAAHRAPVRGPLTERPPALALRSDEGMMLAVARRFAIAYMPYQVGRLPRWGRTAIERTCTPAFARYLLAQPAQPTPLQAAHPNAIESYRLQRTQQLNDRRSLKLMLRATACELAQRTPDADDGHRRDPTHAHEPIDLGATAFSSARPDRAERELPEIAVSWSRPSRHGATGRRDGPRRRVARGRQGPRRKRARAPTSRSAPLLKLSNGLSARTEVTY
jgi:hypothetical protein